MGCRGLPGCSIIRASLPFANIGVLCAAAHSPCICSRLRVALRFAQQPTGLTLPSGALMVSLPSQISAFCALAARSPCICSRLRVALRCAQQPTGLTLPSGALRVALGLRPKCPQGTRFPSRLAGVWGRLPVAQSSRRAPAAPTARFAPSQISAFCALSARSPCICSRLRVALPPLAATAHRADASLRRTFGSLCAARNSPQS